MSLQLLVLELVAGGALVALLAAGCARLSAQTATHEPAPLLRARGLVIEDEQGRPRLLLGAPVPVVPERKRTDAATGLVLLNADGADRLVLGHDGGPQMGGVVQRRISPSTGLSVNDARGDERGGLGLLDNGRIVLGLDAPEGEGVMLFVAPDLKLSGLFINGHEGGQEVQRLTIVTTPGGESAVSLLDAKGRPRTVLSVKDDEPALKVLDEDGATTRDALSGR